MARVRLPAELGQWSGPFAFVQMADTQLGMLQKDRSWQEEADNFNLAVTHINRLKPRFVVVCGDLVNAQPSQKDVQERQVADFKSICDKIDHSIALICVCGNHDVGDTPTPETMTKFNARFGPDYFSFFVGDVHCLALNSSYMSDPSQVQELAQKQDDWLAQQLATPVPRHRMVFTHIPPFIDHPDEPDGYFNLEPERRKEILTAMKSGGVTKWFCGHFHRNAGGFDDTLEVVITTATGTTIETVEGEDPLGIAACGTFSCSPESSGFRIVHVAEDTIKHKFFTLSTVPDAVQPNDW